MLMKQIINKFLDESIGSGVKFWNRDNFYNVYSDNKSLIFSFRMKEDWKFVKIYRYEPLCRKVSSLFCVSEDEAARFISNWFGDKYNIVKVRDLRKFVHYI